MKNSILSVALIATVISYAQVGVNTKNPQGIFNVDGAKDNSSTEAPTTTQQANDFVITKEGSAGVGTTVPDAHAKLHVSSQNQGILIPSVTLTSNIMDLNADGDDDVSNQPTGLLLYNKGTALTPGYYFWNGSEWRTIDNSSAVIPSISELLCSSAS